MTNLSRMPNSTCHNIVLKQYRKKYFYSCKSYLSGMPSLKINE